MGRILIIIAIAAFMFYVITRVRAFRLQDSLEKRILESRARLALGATMSALGVNLAFFSFYTAIQLIVGAVFLIFGLANAIYGFRAHKHYAAQLD